MEIKFCSYSHFECINMLLTCPLNNGIDGCFTNTFSGIQKKKLKISQKLVSLSPAN